jgi:predicted permease
MIRTLHILQKLVFFLSAFAVGFAAVLAQAADSAGGKPEEGVTDYMLSYLVVILGLALGVLVVAKASNRRDRGGPTGYVEKNLAAED